MRHNCFLTPPRRFRTKILFIVCCVTSVIDWDHCRSGSLSNGNPLPPAERLSWFFHCSELLCAASVKCNFLGRHSMNVRDGIKLRMMLGRRTEKIDINEEISLSVWGSEPSHRRWAGETGGPGLIVEEVTVTRCSYFSTLDASDQQSGLLFPHETSGSLWVMDHLKKPITWEEPAIPTLKSLSFPQHKH